ncbi:MAG TPA: DUF4282 domain-containing protein [Thermoclostridium sp.]
MIRFGQYNLNTLVNVLFWIGNIPVAIYSYIIGNYIFNNSTYDRIISKSGNFTQYEEVNNLPLGVFAGVLAFIAGVIIWRIICEFIYVIVKNFQADKNL